MTSAPCTCTKLRRSARTLTALYDEALAPSGLTTPQFALLRTLDRAGPCSLTAFAERTGHDRTTLSRTIGALEAQGHVRFEAGADKRSRAVSLTEQGSAAIARALPCWSQAEDRIEALLGPDRARLFAILDRIEALPV
ncbi:MarR family winged helix-turn-helix transcriptional regulator [Sphingobium boeckii]|uniref:DNA-binding MarR family transcriptional regulator n=1 Tax=Sphingobium boeckii TaxID=1082345 RepID=A0A7W9EDV8_9SPHN|nr:MarR family transcriptional regulator [Sphingobium boeckii]MBB5685324.1 DNA-binding MarR family transcriptional regulator [Sphingobium boeckii]